MQPSIMSVEGSILCAVAILLVWLTIYLFREIIQIAERVERRGLGSGLILLAMPLMLLYPIISGYFFLTTGMTAPADWSAVAIVGFLLSSCLVLVPIWNFTHLSNTMKVPIYFLIIYAILYPALSFHYIMNLPLAYRVVQVIYLLAELLLGFGFILLARYTADFRERRITLAGKEFSTRFELSSFLMITGVALPIDAVIRAVALSDFFTSEHTEIVLMQVQELRLLSFGLLTGIALGGLVGMLVFRRAVGEFCVRMGSMRVLLGKESEIGPKEFRKKR